MHAGKSPPSRLQVQESRCTVCHASHYRYRSGSLVVSLAHVTPVSAYLRLCVCLYMPLTDGSSALLPQRFSLHRQPDIITRTNCTPPVAPRHRRPIARRVQDEGLPSPTTNTHIAKPSTKLLPRRTECDCIPSRIRHKHQVAHTYDYYYSAPWRRRCSTRSATWWMG